MMKSTNGSKLAKKFGVEFKPYTGRDLEEGDFIKLKDKSIHLVGDVNALLGVCDDCKLCGKKQIVEIASLNDVK